MGSLCSSEKDCKNSRRFEDSRISEAKQFHALTPSVAGSDRDNKLLERISKRLQMRPKSPNPLQGHKDCADSLGVEPTCATVREQVGDEPLPNFLTSVLENEALQKEATLPEFHLVSSILKKSVSEYDDGEDDKKSERSESRVSFSENVVQHSENENRVKQLLESLHSKSSKEKELKLQSSQQTPQNVVIHGNAALRSSFSALFGSYNEGSNPSPPQA